MEKADILKEVTRVSINTQDLPKEDKHYLTNHPEIVSLVEGFVTTLLKEKPSEVYDFSKKYFGSLPTLPIFKPLIMSGPSGVGKGTILKKILAAHPSAFDFSVSLTTRQPRPGEKHGVDYYFVALEDFTKEIAKDSFMEYCEVHGNYYGTHKTVVSNIMRQGKICILDIDVQGAEKIFKSGVDCNYIFIEPPAIETLKERLTKRGTETVEQIEKRIKNATGELAKVNELSFFKNRVVNDEFETCYKNFVNTLGELYPQAKLSQ